MEPCSPPKLIVTLQLPKDCEMEMFLSRRDAKKWDFDDQTYNNLYQVDVLLNKGVSYGVKMAASVDQTVRPGDYQFGSLSRQFLKGDFVQVQPGTPVTLLGLIYQYRYKVGDDPLVFKLNLILDFTFAEREETRQDVTRRLISHSNNLGSLLKLGNFADCQVVTNDGRAFDCHKAIISLKSSVIQKAIKASDAAKPVRIRLNCDTDIATLFLQHLYTGQMPEIPEGSAKEWQRLVVEYEVEDFRAAVGVQC